MTPFITLISTQFELKQFKGFCISHSLDNDYHWIDQYSEPDPYRSLPALMGYHSPLHCTHQPIYEKPDDLYRSYATTQRTVESLLEDYFSDLPFIPFHALMNPSNYPEFYV